MKVVALLLATTLFAGCFPNSAKHRTYAKIGEGAAIATGIAMLYTVNTGADCDQMRDVSDETSSGCRGNADILGSVGLGLIIAGMSGFIATVSTTPDDEDDKPANTLTPTPIAASSAAADAPAAPAPTATAATSPTN